MIVYKCRITDDEMFTDIYPMSEEKGVIKLKGKFVTRVEGQVDDKLIGGNASAEEPGEGGSEAATVSGCNVVLDNRLNMTGFGSKKEFTAYFKDYCKALEAKLKIANPDEDYTEWRANITNSYKHMLSMFKDFEFFTGNSGNPDGSIMFMKWETPEGETDEVPYCYFFKDGLKEEKF